MARQEFVHQLDEGEKALADDGYQDLDYFIYPIAFPDTGAFQKRKMARHETVNKRFKQFAVLRHAFRHEHSFHTECFYAIAFITELSIRNGETLFEIDDIFWQFVGSNIYDVTLLFLL